MRQAEFYTLRVAVACSNPSGRHAAIAFDPFACFGPGRNPAEAMAVAIWPRDPPARRPPLPRADSLIPSGLIRVGAASSRGSTSTCTSDNYQANNNKSVFRGEYLGRPGSLP
jgi:hypothetical protein